MKCGHVKYRTICWFQALSSVLIPVDRELQMWYRIWWPLGFTLICFDMVRKVSGQTKTGTFHAIGHWLASIRKVDFFSLNLQFVSLWRTCTIAGRRQWIVLLFLFAPSLFCALWLDLSTSELCHHPTSDGWFCVVSSSICRYLSVSATSTDSQQPWLTTLWSLQDDDNLIHGPSVRIP